MYILYRLITTVTQNVRKTSSNCIVKEVQPWFACCRVKISHCNWLCDRLIEVKYNKISQLGIIRGDRLKEVKFTVNRGTDIWEFEKCPFYRGWPLNRRPLNRGPLNRGPLNRGLTVSRYVRRQRVWFLSPLMFLNRVMGFTEMAGFQKPGWEMGMKFRGQVSQENYMFWSEIIGSGFKAAHTRRLRLRGVAPSPSTRHDASLWH